MGRACSPNRGRYENTQNLAGKPTGNRLLGRPRRRWEDNIGIGINAGNWVDSAQDRDYWTALVDTALNLRVS